MISHILATNVFSLQSIYYTAGMPLEAPITFAHVSTKRCSINSYIFVIIYLSSTINIHNPRGHSCTHADNMKISMVSRISIDISDNNNNNNNNSNYKLAKDNINVHNAYSGEIMMTSSQRLELTRHATIVIK